MSQAADLLVIPSINEDLVDRCLEAIDGTAGVILARRGMHRERLNRYRAAGWTIMETGRLNYSFQECHPVLGRRKFTRAIVLCRNARADLDRYDNVTEIALHAASHIVYLDSMGGEFAPSRARLVLSFGLRRARKTARLGAVFLLFCVTAIPLLVLAPLLRLRTAIRSRNNRLRVLLTGRDISNQTAPFVRFLRTRNIRAESLLLSVHPYSCEPGDREENLEAIRGARRFLRLAWHYLRSMVAYDVILFLYGYESFWAKPSWTDWTIPRCAQRLELRLATWLGKKTVFLFRDCKLRRRASQSARESLGGCRDCTTAYESRFCGSDEVISRAETALRAADAVLVSTPDLLLDAPAGARWLPNAIELPAAVGASPSSPFPDGRLLILHSSTYPAIKRTAVLERVVDRLSQRYPITLKILKGLPHQEFMGWVARCDIAVDQFAHGAHGQFAVECMAAGKPVIGWILRDLYPPSLPIISPDIRNLEAELERNLEALIRSSEMRREAGAKGAAYVREVHEISSVGERLLSILADLQPGKSPAGRL